MTMMTPYGVIGWESNSLLDTIVMRPNERVCIYACVREREREGGGGVGRLRFPWQSPQIL